MNLSARITRLEKEKPVASRIIPICAIDEEDAARQESEMRNSGKIGPQDIIVITMWGYRRD